MKYVIQANDGAYKHYPGDSLSSRYDDNGYSTWEIDYADYYDSFISAKQALHDKGKFSLEGGAEILGLKLVVVPLEQYFWMYEGFGFDSECNDVTGDKTKIAVQHVGHGYDEAIDQLHKDLKNYGIAYDGDSIDNDKVEDATNALLNSGWKKRHISYGP